MGWREGGLGSLPRLEAGARQCGGGLPQGACSCSCAFRSPKLCSACDPQQGRGNPQRSYQAGSLTRKEALEEARGTGKGKPDSSASLCGTAALSSWPKTVLLPEASAHRGLTAFLPQIYLYQFTKHQLLQSPSPSRLLATTITINNSVCSLLRA